MPDITLKSASRRPDCPSCGRPRIIIDLYCRVSEDYDGDGGLRSVEDQEFDGAEFVKSQGCCYTVGKVWRDPDLSGWKVNVVRPDFIKCMHRLTTGETDGLWVYDVTRFSRKPDEGHHMVDAAERGVHLFSNNHRRDLRTADDLKWFRDRLADAEYESKRLSERVRRGKKLGAVRRGKRNTAWRGYATLGNRPPPPGWKKANPGEVFPVEPESLEVVVAEQEIVRGVAAMLLGGARKNECIRWMNDQGARTYKGNPWSSVAFRTLMRRASLAGYLVYDGRIVEGRDLPRPWALERDVFAHIQELLPSDPGPQVPMKLLSGLMFCFACGRSVRSGGGHGPASASGRRPIYTCSGSIVHGVRACGKAAITVAYADDVIAQAVKKRMSNAQLQNRLVALGAESEARRKALLTAIRQAEQQVEDQSERLGTGAITSAAFDRFLSANTGRTQKLRDELAAIPTKPAARLVAAEAVRQWDDADDGTTAGMMQRREMVREAFPRLTLLKSRVRGRGSLYPERFDLDGHSLDLLKAGRPVE